MKYLSIMRAAGAILLLRMAAPGFAATYFVATTGSDANAGTQALPFATIKKGLQTAVSGDAVIVADGTYTGAGNTNLDFGGKNIRLQSRNGAQKCILDCQNTARAFLLQTGETTVLIQGFTVRNGSATDSGGGALCKNSSSTFLSCVFTGCQAHASGDVQGGGIAVAAGGNVLLSRCQFAGNKAVSSSGSAFGGAVSISGGGHAILFNTAVTLNTCLGSVQAYGAGVDATDGGSTLTLTNSNIASNRAQSANGPAYGGGVAVRSAATATLSNTVVVTNLTDISAASGGGGLYATNNGTVTATNCTFALNVGTGSNVGHNVLVNGDGTIAGHVTFYNSILTGYGGNTVTVMNGGTSVLKHCFEDHFQSFVDASGNFGSVNIGFVRAPSRGPDFFTATADDDWGDLHLAAGSPCIDKGDPAAVGIRPYDADGNTRIAGAAPDMGAYEFGAGLTAPTDYYVDKATGNDANAGTTTAPFKTVTKGLDAALTVPSAVVHIKAGNYGTDRPRAVQRVMFVNWNNTGQARIGAQ